MMKMTKTKRMLCVAALLAMTGGNAAQACEMHRLQAELGEDVCKYVVTHQPAADVAYQPGVDVHGKPVVEADLNPSPVAMPEKISFSVTVDVAKYTGLAVPAGTEMQAAIGTVTVDRQGHMTFNGQPMEGEAQAALRALCAGEEPATKTPIPVD